MTGPASSAASTSTAGDGLVALFPHLGLSIAAGDLTLRPFREEDLPEYVELLRRPIFEDEDADHVFPWYATDPESRLRGALQFQWRQRAELSRERWSLPLAIRAHGELIGSQDIVGAQFSDRRTVSSGSWLTRDAHGRGYGTLMRQAILVLAFDHLGARRAESAAVLGNERSFRVSAACGYVADGTEVVVEGGRTLTHQRFLCTPETFRRPEAEIRVEGVTAALREQLGA
ncbi:GNAT family N-acetyltransferase [Brachybacterium sp. DNPG3]